MAPTLKRKGIAVSNRPPAKRHKSTSKRGTLNSSRPDQALPPGYQDGEWPLKRILREGKNKYLVIKEDVGTAAEEEWKEEKQQKEIRASERAERRQEEHSIAARLRSRRGSVYGADRASSLEIIHEAEETPRVRRQRHSKKQFISSSPPPPEIPETQQEISSLERGEISIDIYRPAGFDSQDWSSLRGSQLASVIPSQNTVSSKDTTESDSTLGSSLPPDSPIQAEVQSSAPQVEESSSLVIQPYFPSGSESGRNSRLSVPLYNQSISSSVDLPSLTHGAHVDQQRNLLVVRSESLGNGSTGPSRPAEVQAEHASTSPPSSPLFVTDEEDLDLRPIAEPGGSREESPTEGELEFLPVASSPVRSSIQDSVRLRATNSSQSSVVISVRAQRSQSWSTFSAQLVNARQPEAEREGRPQLFSTPIKTVLGTSTRLLDTDYTKSSTSTTSRRFYSQDSFPKAPASGVQSFKAKALVNTPRNSELASSSHCQLSAAQSLPQSVLQTALSAARISKHTSPLQHRTSARHHFVSSGALILPSIKHNMSNSHRDSSPRVRRAPSSPPETTPELGLREKLRQIRATSRANQDARSRSQVNTGHAKSPATKTLETRFSRRVSPEKHTESSATASAPTQDQPIPSLENVDGHTGEMEVETVDNEPALSSSLALPPPILNLSLGKTIMPTQLNDVDKAISELDIPTMPLRQPAEFVVPLPIDGRIMHQYVAELTKRYKEIADFLNSPRSPRLIGAMNDMIRQLNDTVIHTDLGLNGPATQVVPSSQEALWAEDASSKFAFLGEMINNLRGSNHHIVVTAGSGPRLDLLHNYLLGKGVNCRRHSDFGTTTVGETCQPADQTMYTLISTQNGALKELPRSSSLLIAFDDSLDAAILPEWWCSTERFIPVLLLLVVNSAEHVGRCIPKDVPEPERLRRLIKAAVHVHKRLGEMPFHSDFRQAFNLDQGGRLALVKKDLGAKIAYAATKTTEALSSQNFALNFTLRPITELDLSGLEDYPPSTEESKGVSSSGSRAGTPGGQKRLRDERSSSALQPKRQRMTPLQDITHISDSIKNSQSQIDELKAALKKTQQEASEERKARLKAEESAVYMRNRLTEISQSLGDVQHRYETRMKQVHQLERQKQRTLQEREVDAQRHVKVTAENMALKDQRHELQDELRIARDALKTSSVPAIADLELARESTRKANEAAAALHRSNDSLRREIEFTRSAYQDASTKAAEYASEVTDLEAQTVDLKRQASDERRRLTELNTRDDTKRHLARIAELELERANREAVLRRVEEENKTLRKGRGGVATRGSSVQPIGGGGGASPRTGLGQPPGSRGGSPAPGGLMGVGGSGSVLVGGRASALRNER